MQINPSDIQWDDETPTTTQTATPASAAPISDITWDDEAPATSQPAAPKRRRVPTVTFENVEEPAPQGEVTKPSSEIEFVDDTATRYDVAAYLPPEKYSNPEYEAEIKAAVANPNSTADDLRAIAEKYDLYIQNADEVIDYRNKTGKASSSVNYDMRVEQPDDGATGAGARGFGSGALFNFLDEAGAVVDTLGGTDGRQNLWNSDQSFGELFSRNVAANREILDGDFERHPYATIAGNVAGGLVTMKPANAVGEAAGLANLGQTSRAAAQGAGEGALYGAGGAEGGLTERFKGAVGGAGTGAVIGVGIDKTLGSFARQAQRDAQAGQEVLDAAKSLNTQYGTNIRPVASEVGGMSTRAASRLNEDTFIGGMAATNRGEKLASEAKDAAEGVTGGLTRLEDTAEGMVARGDGQGLAALPDRLKSRYTAMYDRASTLAGNSKLATPKTIAALDAEITRLEQVPGGVAGLDKLKKLRTDLQNGGTVEGLRLLRTTFGDSLDVTNRTARTSAKKLWGSLSDDITDGLTAAGKKDAALAYRRADSAYRNAQDHTAVIDKLFSNKSGVQVADSLASMSRKDSDRLQDIMRLASPEEAASIRAGLVERMGRAKASAQDAEGSVFSLETFLTSWAKLPEPAKARLFTGQLRTDLTNLAKVAEGARRGGTSAFKGERSAMRLVEAYVAFKSGGGSIAGSTIGGMLLSSPRFARVLVAWGKSGGTRAELAKELGRVSTRLTAGEGQDAVNGFIGWLNSGNAETPPATPAPAAAQEAPLAPSAADGLGPDAFDNIDEYAFQPEGEEDMLMDEEDPMYYETDVSSQQFSDPRVLS